MLKRVILTIGLAFMIIAGCSTEQADEYAMIMFMIGDVTRNNAAVSVGDLLKQSDVIKTGNNAFCDIRIGGSIVRIKENSKVLFSDLSHKGNEENTTLGLNVGKMLCKPKRLMKEENFIVKTPTAVAAVRGTQFIVEADIKETTRIKVFTGKLKIAKRIQQLEGNIDKILSLTPELNEQEKIVITKNDVTRAEKIVGDMLEKETEKGGDKAIDSVIDKAKGVIIIGGNDITKFTADDFAKDQAEIIKVKERPKEVIRQIVKVIQQEKEMPRRYGRLLITKFEVYYIQNGKVLWEGKVYNSPIHINKNLYIASDNYVFCAADDGPVMWRINMMNDGKIEIRDNKLVVFSQGSENFLDLKTGQQY